MESEGEFDEEFWRIALEGRRYVQLDYPRHGTGPLEQRTIQPLAYGRCVDKHGEVRIAVRYYQIEPEDKGGDGTYKPKLLYVSNIGSARPLDLTFEVPETYRENDSALDVICELHRGGEEGKPTVG